MTPIATNAIINPNKLRNHEYFSANFSKFNNPYAPIHPMKLPDIVLKKEFFSLSISPSFYCRVYATHSPKKMVFATSALRLRTDANLDTSDTVKDSPFLAKRRYIVALSLPSIFAMSSLEIFFSRRISSNFVMFIKGSLSSSIYATTKD